MLLIALRLFVFALGVGLVAFTLLSAIRTFILPRGATEWLVRNLFITLRKAFTLLLRKEADYGRRDAIMALYAPVGLLLIVPMWLVIVALGFAAMYWAVGVGNIDHAAYLSGSSLLTLGMVGPSGPQQMALAFCEATIGLILVALLISYLPTIYGAFSRREAAVTLLEVRAGSPPSAGNMIVRFHTIQGLDGLRDMWEEWERWFAELEETHTSLAALTFFRSPVPERSWITAAGAVLDGAAVMLSAVDVTYAPEAALCIRSGYLSLRRIADTVRLPYDPAPAPTDAITVRPDEFEALLDRLAAAGVPLFADRRQAWLDYAGWRVNYDRVLVQLAKLTMAPVAPWSSDRTLADLCDWRTLEVQALQEVTPEPAS